MIPGSDSLTASNMLAIDNIQPKALKQMTSLDGNPELMSDSKLQSACADFEAIFIKQMLDSMRKTVEKTSLLSGGMAEDIFEDMLYDKYAEKMSKVGNFGLKELLYKQLSTISSDSKLKNR